MTLRFAASIASVLLTAFVASATCSDDATCLLQRPRGRWSRGRWPRRWLRRSYQSYQPPSQQRFSLPFGYTILGPGRQVVARLLLPIDEPCPNELHVSRGYRAQVIPVRVRAEPHVGLHGVWYTEGERFQHVTGINYTYANPLSPFTYEDRVCEAQFSPEFLGEGVVATFRLQDGSVDVPLPPSQPSRYVVLGDTGLRVKAKNDGWCSENLGAPKDLYGGETCPPESVLSRYNASIVNGLFQSTSPEANPALNGWVFQELCERVERFTTFGDVMVHVGDYLYTHNACPFPFPDQAPRGEERVFGDCADVGGRWGDTSAGWIREFFGPAAGLLRRLPWIVLRGNHEECERAGHGWFRYLDPRPSELFDGGGDTFAPYCVTYTESYNVEFDHDNWLVVDTSTVADEDISIDAFPPVEYSAEAAEAAGTDPVLSMDNCNTKPNSGDDFISIFQKLNDLSIPGRRQWFASHRPLFGLTFQNESSALGPQLYSFQCQLTDALAKSNLSLPNVAAVVSGHFHSWQLVQFQDKRPAQLVSGNSGTQLATPRDGSPNGIFRAAGRPLLGKEITYSETVGEFGWTELLVSDTDVTMSAGFLSDDGFASRPKITRALVPATLYVEETWMQMQ